jgi:putative AdoMet-dependent methyltransferase
MEELFSPAEFDDWAASYDQSVVTDSGFPFDGYSRTLQTIVDQAALPQGSAVLDLGTGTGNLAVLFSRQNHELWCLDFSAQMLELARVKLPGANFAQVDIRGDWPGAFRRRYDGIVSGYTFHHFPLEEKVVFIQRLLVDHLSQGGCLVIGDLAFPSAIEEEALRCKMGEAWEQEYYWLADEALAAFSAIGIIARFTAISSCAGVFHISRLPKI